MALIFIALQSAGQGWGTSIFMFLDLKNRKAKNDATVNLIHQRSLIMLPFS
jgi:hypothetical protein